MKVLVIGSGGREHALVWKLNQSKKIDKIFCAPGNAGIGQIAKCVRIKPESTKALVDFASRNKINLTVVGPEAPLTKGIVDEFQKRKLRIFGPNKKAAELEGSKVFAKEFMRKYHIPTAPFKVFDNPAEAIGFCKSVEFPVVIKADGLAAGKGAVIVKNMKQAESTIDDIMVQKSFGQAGDQIIIESCLKGQEVSIMALCDGKTIAPFLPSQDHKQALDGDRGPNTGGMGAYCPTNFTDDEVMEQIQEHIIQRTLAGLNSEGIKYKGIIYAGIMLTAQGPKVLEYNCRFGDPETQAVLPLLKSDLLDLMRAVVDEKLASRGKLAWHTGAAACVIMASRGYPGKYATGFPISGLTGKHEDGTYVFHAGTEMKDNNFVTSGGRVLGVMGRDKSLKGALSKAYRAVGKIKFEGASYRKDIGFRASKPVEEQV
ncbi:MAG TPA: phosphoribosylamine--glycine ligase [candidate division Zixibacteria bacterium]|nr:phosphoribosylamine--glycine ligase [candidate division Zixibacteria bacterium]